jgi:hypothetical protein
MDSWNFLRIHVQSKWLHLKEPSSILFDKIQSKLQSKDYTLIYF